METRRTVALVCWASVAVALSAGVALSLASPDDYYRLVQEDELLEWGTTCCFFLAALLHLREAVRARSSRKLALLLLAIAALSFFIAMEEISWGQRLLGFRPPEAFLESNFQQELNLHDLFARWMRKAAVLGLIVGHGLALPALSRLALLTPYRRALSPRELMPIFAVALVLQVVYPLRFTGEWVELIIGSGFLFAPLVRQAVPGGAILRSLSAVACVLVLALGLSAWSRHVGAVSPLAIESAELELASLASDLQGLELEPGAHGHARLYSLVRHRGWTVFEGGKHAALVAGGLPEDRAEYLLDPWNSPYWLRYRHLEDGSVQLLLYSLGPNRMRESVGDRLGGDDLGFELLLPGAPP